MRFVRKAFWMGPLVFSIFLGCAHSGVLPKYDEILVYPLPYDLTFLRVLEAVNSHPDWQPSWTDKEKGVIELHNVRYSSFADADQRSATLKVNRLGHHETSVQLAPKSQSVVGGDEILKIIKDFLS